MAVTSNFSWQASLQTSVNKFFDYLPQIVGSLVILIIGWLVARALQTVVRNLLRRLRFDRAMHTSAAGRYIARVVESPSRLAGQITFWLVFLVALSLAASALNLDVLNRIIDGIYAYIPKVIAAILIFLVASAVAAGADTLVLRLLGRSPMARIITAIIPTVALSIAGFMILDELEIAREIVNITYGALMGSLALGMALAFGLGGRDLARNILDQAYETTTRNAGAIRSEATRATRNARRAANAAEDEV